MKNVSRQLLFLLLSDSLFHMEAFIEIGQFQFTENGMPLDTLMINVLLR